MSTKFYGDVPVEGTHHTATVRDGYVDFEVYCPQCRQAIGREIDKNRANRMAAYHNTTFIDRPPAPPVWAGNPTGPNVPEQQRRKAALEKVVFDWNTWLGEEFLPE